MDADIIRMPRENRRIAHGETIPRWSRTSRLALGLLTLVIPMVAAGVAIWGVVSPPDAPSALLGVALTVFIAHFILTMLYVAFASQNPRLGMQGTWMAALVFAGPVAIPVYWLMHVWNAPQVGRDDVDEEVPGYDEADARAEGALS